jgi:hypothetical protein
VALDKRLGKVDRTDVVVTVGQVSMCQLDQIQMVARMTTVRWEAVGRG